MPSHVHKGRTSDDPSDLRIVAMLCLPSIIGTAFFLTGAIVLQVFGPGDAPPVEFGESTAPDRIEAAIGLFLPRSLTSNAVAPGRIEARAIERRSPIEFVVASHFPPGVGFGLEGGVHGQPEPQRRSDDL